MKTEDDLIIAITKLAELQQQAAKQAIGSFHYEVSEIIRTKNHQNIEHIFDRMLNYCFDDEVLEEYKRLLIYYFPIDPESVEFYVRHYQKMYESDDLEE
jgi:hypothetical protein